MAHILWLVLSFVFAAFDILLTFIFLIYMVVDGTVSWITFLNL